MTARKHPAVCARASTDDPIGLDAETARLGKLVEPVVLLTPERPLAALAQPMGAA